MACVLCVSMTVVLIGFIIEELACMWFDIVKSIGESSIKVQMTTGNFFDTSQEESKRPINQLGFLLQKKVKLASL
jgi:hypothetical protein